MKIATPNDLENHGPRQTNAANYKWGEIDGNVFSERINRAYEEVVRFRKNLFLLPSGSVGNWYVTEKAKFFEAMVSQHPMEKIAMKALSVMEHLLLQRASQDSTTKRNKELLTERIALWEKGDIDQLTTTAMAIQERLETHRKKMNDEELARKFARFMFTGRIRDALTLLEKHGERSSALKLTRQVQKTLAALHPEPGDFDQEVLLDGNIPPVDPVLFEPITEQLISKAVLELQGSHGPSGGDAAHWKRLTLSFGCKSKRLREAMAKFARRMCTERMDPEVLEAFLANRLVAIDKCPGVRPVGIGEAPRRIIGKGIVKVLKKDIQMAAGSYNLCAGQAVGIEALIHAMIEAFELMSTEAAFLADASNAFNRLNRKVALWNIQYICPPLTIVLYNTYGHPTRMFVLGGFELSSKEGTTQGCPLAMAMYALGVIPLI